MAISSTSRAPRGQPYVGTPSIKIICADCLVKFTLCHSASSVTSGASNVPCRSCQFVSLTTSCYHGYKVKLATAWQLRCGCCRSMYFIHNRRSARLGSKQWTSCVDGPNCKTYMALMSGLYTCFWLCTTVWSARVEKEIKVRISRGVEYRITLLSVINETAPHSILLIYKIHYVALLSSISRRQLGQEAPPPKHLSVVLPYAMIGASGNDRVHPDTF